MTGYYTRETDRTGYHALRENEAIGASYDRYLRNGVQLQVPLYKYTHYFKVDSSLTFSLHAMLADAFCCCH